jgi:HK97 family phage portal protein
VNITDRFKRAWSVFNSDYNPTTEFGSYSGSSSFTQKRGRFNENYISGPVFNRIALDVSGVDIQEVTVDYSGKEWPQSSKLNDRLTYSANIDQTGRAFIQDIVHTMLTNGHAVIVPIDTTSSPISTDAYDILSWRVGTVTQWMSRDVRVNVWDDHTSLFKEIVMPKEKVAIIQNPIYGALNDANGTLQRLLGKLNQLDQIDDELANGKLNLIMQLPYVVKGEARRAQANQRIAEFEDQVSKGKYGVAYADGTEKITQLNRSLDNNILSEIEALTTQFYNQLGLSASVFNGTAKEDELRIYYSRTVDPIVESILDEMNRKFISLTAYTQGHRISSHRDPFKLMPTDKVATVADTFIRNAILTTNEMRKIIGYTPSDNESADELFNPNIAAVNQDTAGANLDVAGSSTTQEPDGGDNSYE